MYAPARAEVVVVILLPTLRSDVRPLENEDNGDGDFKDYEREKATKSSVTSRCPLRSCEAISSLSCCNAVFASRSAC